jgi:hypothetical protein
VTIRNPVGIKSDIKELASMCTENQKQAWVQAREKLAFEFAKRVPDNGFPALPIG